MNSSDAKNQEIIEALVGVSRALKVARATLRDSGYYVGSTNKPIWNRIAKANEAIAEAIGTVSLRVS